MKIQSQFYLVVVVTLILTNEAFAFGWRRPKMTILPIMTRRPSNPIARLPRVTSTSSLNKPRVTNPIGTITKGIPELIQPTGSTTLTFTKPTASASTIVCDKPSVTNPIGTITKGSPELVQPTGSTTSIFTKPTASVESQGTQEAVNKPSSSPKDSTSVTSSESGSNEMTSEGLSSDGQTFVIIGVGVGAVTLSAIGIAMYIKRKSSADASRNPNELGV